jgi:hypothetical protein
MAFISAPPFNEAMEGDAPRALDTGRSSGPAAGGPPEQNWTRRVFSRGWVGFFTAIYSTLQPLQNANVYQKSTPLTGAMVQMVNQAMYLLLVPAGTLASLTVIFPSNPTDAEPIHISTTQTITALTLIAASPTTISNAPTTLAAGAAIRYMFSLTDKVWYPI